MTFLKFISLLILCGAISSCCTAKVLTIGVEQEDLWETKGGKVLMNSNGDLAIEIKAIDHTPKYGSQREMKKYKLIRKDQLAAAAEEQKARRLNRRLTPKDQEYNNTFTLWRLKGFELAPPPFSDGEPAITQVEATYSIPYMNVQRNQNHSDTIYFDYGGEKYELPSDPRPHISGYEYEKTHWWGYPFRILALPAIAIDIVTFPVQIPAMKKSLENWN